jgi:hypothetical protein
MRDSQEHGLQTTPPQIHDAVETQIPSRYRAEVNVLFWQLKQDAPIIRDSAIIRGHAVASQLKAIAESKPTPGLYTDAEPSACLMVANHLYAAMDEARRRSPSPYPGGTTSDSASPSDLDAAYQAMVAHDANAWRTPHVHTSTHQSDSGQPTQLGDRETEYQKMIERNANEWKTAHKGA